ncbi:MAG: hypothetical protein ACPL7B_14690 [Candidatus Poribacteria bacterium]
MERNTFYHTLRIIQFCESYNDEKFEDFMEDLFNTVTVEDRFILGVADNVMPETVFNRLVCISEIVG